MKIHPHDYASILYCLRYKFCGRSALSYRAAMGLRAGAQESKVHVLYHPSSEIWIRQQWFKKTRQEQQLYLQEGYHHGVEQWEIWARNAH